MPVYTDQTGREVSVSGPARRIVSLVPSQTELLYDFGLDEEVAGITKFCVHPESWFRSKTRVGGTKEVNMATIHQLMPDLIIANKEENVKEQVDELAAHFPVWVSDVSNLEDAYDMIRQLGILTQKEARAAGLIARIRQNFSAIPANDSGLPACYLIWQKPYMTVGADTFIHSLLTAAGFENLFKDRTRYPEISIEELQKAGCKLLLLSSEPFPFKQKHADELQPLLPGTRILPVDGKLFSWYGSRLLHFPAYILNLQAKIAELSRQDRIH